MLLSKETPNTYCHRAVLDVGRTTKESDTAAQIPTARTPRVGSGLAAQSR